MPNEHEPEHRDHTQAVITVTPDGPAIAPATMSADEIELARTQAEALVRGVRKSTGSRQLAVLDEVTSVGVESQRNAGRQLELVKTRLATFLDAGGASKDVALELVELRGALDRINPELEQRSLWGRTVGLLPFMRDNAMVRALKKVALRYEPVSKEITVIEGKLREGRTLLGPRQRGAPAAVRGRRGPAGSHRAAGLPRRAAVPRPVPAAVRDR